MQHLSMTTLAVLDDLHEQLCRDVPMIGGEYRLCGAQINALRAALPRMIALERPATEGHILAARETSTTPPWLAPREEPFLNGYPDDWEPLEIDIPHIPGWWQRFKRWCRGQADDLGDICDE